MVGEVQNIQGLANNHGCRITSLPMKYLGLPLGVPFKAKSIWDPISERMQRRLVGRKRIYLTKEGSRRLIKSMLLSLPTYFFSLFPNIVGVENRPVKIQRDFLWGGMGNEFKFHWVNCNTCCLPFHFGGLGIKKVILFN